MPDTDTQHGSNTQHDADADADSDTDSDSDSDTEVRKDGMYIVIDKRERAVIPCLHTPPIPCFVEHMTVGDMAICYNGKIVLIIERKTWQDLAASMKDGRKANIEKLKDLRASTACQIAYLIEGDAFPAPTRKFGRIPHKNLRAHLDHLAFRDSVHMLYAKTPMDTALRLFELAKNLSSITRAGDRIHEGGNEGALRTKHTSPDSLIISNMWCACKCITINNVSLFTAHPYKLKDLLLGNIQKSTIASLKYDSGMMIGNQRATSIITSSRTRQTHERMLAEIPSVTLATAKKILDVIPMERMLNTDSQEVVDQISVIQKTSKTQVGKACAKKIAKFILL